MAIVTNNQSFLTASTGIIGSTLATQFKTQVDGILYGMGRDVIIHLPPSKTQCSDPSCKFNPFYKRFTGPTNQMCDTCRGQGFTLEPRQTVYRANLRWTDEAFNESSNISEKYKIGRVGQNFLRMKTQAVSMEHIRTSVGATVDTINIELFEEPRYTGFGNNLFYVISWWKVVNN